MRPSPPLVTVVGLLLPALFLAHAPARAQSAHPLDALSAAEIEQAVDVLRDAGRLTSEMRFALIDLHEPAKAQVQEDLESGVSRRAVRLMVYDWATHVASEAVVDLTSREIASWVDQDDDEPPIRRLVISRLNEVVKSNPEWQEAVRRFGISDFSRINVLAGMAEDTRLQRVDGDLVVRGSAFMMDERPEAMGLPVAARVNPTRGEVLEVTSPEGATSTPSAERSSRIGSWPRS